MCLEEFKKMYLQSCIEDKNEAFDIENSVLRFTRYIARFDQSFHDDLFHEIARTWYEAPKKKATECALLCFCGVKIPKNRSVNAVLNLACSFAERRERILEALDAGAWLEERFVQGERDLEAKNNINKRTFDRLCSIL